MGKIHFLPLTIKYFGYILLIFLPCLTFGQNQIYEHPPAFAKKHGIKRITQFRYTSYHEEKNVPPDSSQMFEFNREGVEVFSCSYLKNERYYWQVKTLDGENRVVKDERFNQDGLKDVSEYNYLSNGDYIIRYHSLKNKERIGFSKYFFDENGNEIRREDWNKDSLVRNWDIKTYNDHNLILSRIHQTRPEDTVLNTVYRYKKDTILVKKDFYNKGEFSMRTKYEYYPDGKEKVVYFGKQSSWYYFYNKEGRLSKQMIVRPQLKDTNISVMKYNERGLIESVNNEHKDFQQRREVHTYEKNREVSKSIYTRGDSFNALLETVYFGDTALVIYQTPYWKHKAFHAQYKRLDSHGNVILELQGRVKGKKQELEKWMKDSKPQRHHYEMSESGKILAKYGVSAGWTAESAFCRTYSDDRIHKVLNRRKERRKYDSCDTTKTRRFNGGKHYFISMNGYPNLTRHIYENKSGEVDSILDINKAGFVVNRMVKENGVRITYFLKTRNEYNEMDSIRKVYECRGSGYYATSKNMIEEHFWKNKKKVKIEKHVNHWGHHSSKDLTTITFVYDANFVFRTTLDPQGKTTEERLTYDENNRLIQITELNRNSNGSMQIAFTYDENGNLLERKEIAVRTPTETLFRYEYW